MASPENFARRISRRARSLEEGAAVALRLTAIEADRSVVLSTPVDTGRARANWLAAVNSPRRNAVEATDRSGSSTIQAARAAVERAEADDSIYLSNNVDYIGPLNNGSSAQAPAGFVQRAVLVAANFVRGLRIMER